MNQWDYLISMYPFNVRKIYRYVAEACDRMEYKNSPMYDEYPEKSIIDRMCGSIRETILAEEGPEIMDLWKEEKQRLRTVEIAGLEKEEKRLNPWEEAEDNKKTDAEMGEVHFCSGRPPQGPPPPPPGRPPQGPPPPPPGRPPQRPSNQLWLDDMVKVLLLNEIHHRR